MPGSGRRGPRRVLRRGAPVRQGGAAGRAGLRRGRRERGDRRHLPPGRGPAAGDRARGRLGADAVVPGHRRRAAPRHRAAARRRRRATRRATPASRRCSSIRGGAWARSSARRWRGCRSSTAASRSRARARSPAPRCRCSARSPTSRCWPRTAPACTCTRWCSSSPPCAWATTAARASTEAAHAAHFHRWLRQLEPASESGDREALQAIDRDFENCRRACQFSIAQRPGRGARAQPADAAQLLRASRPLRRRPGAVPAGHRLAAGGRPPAAGPPAQPGGADAVPARALCRSRGDGDARAGRHAPRPAAPGAVPGPRGAGRLRRVHGPLRRGPRGVPAGAGAGAGGRAGVRDRLDARQPRALREAARPLRRIAAPDARGAAAASPPRRQRPRRAVPEQPGLDVDLHGRRRVREAAPARGAAAQRAPWPGLEPRLRAGQPDRAGAEGRRRRRGAHPCRSGARGRARRGPDGARRLAEGAAGAPGDATRRAASWRARCSPTAPTWR